MFEFTRVLSTGRTLVLGKEPDIYGQWTFDPVQTQGSYRMYFKTRLSAATKTHSNWEKTVGEKMEGYDFKNGFILS